MPSKKILGAVAFSAVLAGGGVAGAVLGTPSISAAASRTIAAAASTSGSGTDENTPDGPGDFRHGPMHSVELDAAAKALGMSTTDLLTELQAGKTIAEVAKAKGVDAAKVIDAMVTAGTAELRTRITDMVNNGAPAGGPGRMDGPREGFGHRGHGIFGPDLDAAAQALGISTADLRTELQAGKSVAEVAKAKGVDLNKVIDAVVAKATSQIDQAVKDGKLTQAKADTMKARLKDKVTEMLNRARPAR